jgi:hypothetical protein
MKDYKAQERQKKHRKGVEVEFQNRGFEKHMKKYD